MVSLSPDKYPFFPDSNGLSKPIVVVKASLANVLRDADHLAVYQDRVNTINCSVTAAYLLARYIFVHAYEEEENDDNDFFNADIYMTDAFFMEPLRSLQTRSRRASNDENTLRNRQLINKYIATFVPFIVLSESQFQEMPQSRSLHRTTNADGVYQQRRDAIRNTFSNVLKCLLWCTGSSFYCSMSNNDDHR